MQAQPMQRVERLREPAGGAPGCCDCQQIDIGLDAPPATVMGHKSLLRELLGNLVDNAVRYTPGAGLCVTLRLAG